MFQGDEGNKKSSPQGKKYLTSSTKCGKIYMKRRTTLHKRERVTTMKKSTLSAVFTALKSIDFDAELLAEVEKELNRGEAEKAKNAEMYEVAKPIVLGALSDTPATIGEIYDEIANDLPEGFSKGKVQYAITRLWKDEVTKVEGKVNTYARKA